MQSHCVCSHSLAATRHLKVGLSYQTPSDKSLIPSQSVQLSDDSGYFEIG